MAWGHEGMMLVVVVVDVVKNIHISSIGFSRSQVTMIGQHFFFEEWRAFGRIIWSTRKEVNSLLTLKPLQNCWDLPLRIFSKLQNMKFP